MKRVSYQNKKDVKKEVEILRQLDHPNIVKFYGVVEKQEEESCFMVFEYVPGGDVYDLVRKSGRLSEDDARRIMRQVFFCGVNLIQVNIWCTVLSLSFDYPS